MSSDDLFEDLPLSLRLDLSPASLGSTSIDYSGVVGGTRNVESTPKKKSDESGGHSGVEFDDISIPSDIDLSDSDLADVEKRLSDEDKDVEPSSHSGGDAACSEKKKRRKRGRFKKGVLSRQKGSRVKKADEGETSTRDASEDESEGYMKAVASVMSSKPSAGSEDVSVYSGFESVPSPSDAEEQEACPTEESPSTMRETAGGSHHRKKRIGRKRKYFWKKEKSAESSHELLSRKEIGISVEEADICRAAMASNLSPEENLSLIANYLKLTLDDSWLVSVLNKTLALCQLTNPLNPVVEKCITWDGESLNVLVRNQQLDAENALKELNYSDIQNNVAEYLTSVVKKLQHYEICSGVQSHQHLWSAFLKNVVTENNFEPNCIRASNCSLLLHFPGKCPSCSKLQRKILEHERQKLRTSARENVDRSKANDRYLQKDEIIQKMRVIYKEKRLSEQTVNRLRKRVDQLLKQNALHVNSEMSKDFVKIMSENSEKMTEVEKIFWQQQSLALSKRDASRSMRWHPTMIRMALHLRMLSPAAFDFMRGILSLPSQRTLFDYSQFTEILEGVQEDLLNQFHATLNQNCPEDKDKYFSLLLDEMSVRSDLVFHSRSGELIGFTNLTSLEAELTSLEAEIQGKKSEKNFAKKVLVFMVNSCVNNHQFIAAVYSTDDLSASQLYTRVWEVIYAVEETGAKVLTIIFDGASINRKFIHLNIKNNSEDFAYATVNSASGESRKMYFILDPPHLVKTFRNCFANSHSHRCSRTLCNKDQQISWKAIEALHEIEERKKFKITKLTQAHVYLSSFSCMKVSLAAQVFSNSVKSALVKYKDEVPLKEFYSEELVRFIELMNRCFDSLNGGVQTVKKSSNPDLLEYTSSSDHRLHFLQEEFLLYIKEWENFVSTKEGMYTKDQRARMIISHQSLEGMKITIHSFVEVVRFLLAKGVTSVSGRKFNQDPLEQFFSDLRRARGADDNPTVKQVLHSRLSLHAQGQMIKGGKRGNTEVLQKHFVVDDAPLPKRKMKKKE